MNFEQYRHAQTSDYNMKKVSNEDYSMRKTSGEVNTYTTMFFQKSIDEQNRDKEERFKERLLEFKNVSTKEEARELAKKIMPVKNERTVFRVGQAQCIVLNKENLFRIIFQSKTEFISFNFQ